MEEDQAVFLFLFLTRKQSYTLSMVRAWECLCLKAARWGPLCHDQEKMAQFLESVRFSYRYFGCFAGRIEI